MAKLRLDFITNSSSTCFTITNKTDTDKTLVDFVKETEFVLKEYMGMYGWTEGDDFLVSALDVMIGNAERRGQIFEANSTCDVGYGDEDGDTLGRVYDYGLRNGGETESFEWHFKEYWR